MKQLLFLFLTMLTAVGFFSCSDEALPDESNEKIPSIHDTVTQNLQLKRTIIAYITGDNNLYSDLNTDIQEMITGSRSMDDSCRLVIFADISNKNPYIAEIRKGKQTIVKSYSNDFFSVSPDSMLNILQWIIKKYPANEYATIIEGHGSGAIINQDTVKTNLIRMKAYGYDNTPSDGNSQWINIPSLATVFSYLPKMQFIFMDCCSMGNVETAYELRNTTEYIIAPACETPSCGAPYGKIIPLLNSYGAEQAKSIIDTYASSITTSDICGICLTAIKTSELDALATHTKTILQKMFDNCGDSKLDILSQYTQKPIYYFKNRTTGSTPALQDMRCTFRLAVDNNLITQQDFDSWNAYLKNAVIYKSTPDKSKGKSLWTTSLGINFNDFYDIFDEDHYGAISMIFPDKDYDRAQPSYPSVNATMFKLQWCNAVAWHNYGW